MFEEGDEATEVCVEYFWDFLAEFAQELFGVFDRLWLGVEILFIY